jgi:hypothetical protein
MQNLTDFQKYLISCIDSDGYDTNPVTDTEKINLVLKCFNSEYNNEYNKKRYPNKIVRFREWVQGIVPCFKVVIYNCEILDIAVLLDLISADATEDENDKFLEAWWMLVAKEFFKIDTHIFKIQRCQ